MPAWDWTIVPAAQGTGPTRRKGTCDMRGATLAPWELAPWHTDQPVLAAMADERMRESRRTLRNYYIHNPPTWYNIEDQKK